ncbi:CbiX/SirB N-terminal domain-containing protein [Pelomonas sp. APW6]|uniref:CbiX/SirB N-terminal domain-containing protein n=1 Tax=Roseateles subflavus TaxID=3053353 RepID=A0ABT7LN47_9BURK|nr:CbiX/SirB N-terminal domain-containing protein [Pelomonas sp. APW6]MDL5033894.1 CbiX/SirB N-terminal domain-containing protein [Pelomonas sp. APW6]
MDGLLLFAHGARDPRWAGPFEAVARRIAQQRPGQPVALAFLEFMQPDFATAAAGLIAQGCLRIHVVPMFLGSGGHVQRDLPVLVEQQRALHEGRVEWTLQAPLGEQPRIIEAMAEACLAPLATPSGKT